MAFQLLSVDEISSNASFPDSRSIGDTEAQQSDCYIAVWVVFLKGLQRRAALTVTGVSFRSKQGLESFVLFLVSFVL